MESSRSRMIGVAVLVCLFAVGMAGLLNYFKYRHTADRIVKERLLVIGKSVESSMQLSLALGLHFSELNTLVDTMQREKGTDDLITGIDVFDAEGQRLYTTDAAAAAQTMPEPWLAAARSAGDNGWFVTQPGESAAGLAVKNSFGITLGHLAVRFSAERVGRAHAVVARELALAAAGVFAVAAALASLALLSALRRLARDVGAVAEALKRDAAPGTALAPSLPAGPFGGLLQRFFGTVHQAELELARLQPAPRERV